MQRYSYIFLSSAIPRGARQAIRPFSTNPTIKATGFEKKSDIPSYQRDDKVEFNKDQSGQSDQYRQPGAQAGAQAGGSTLGSDQTKGSQSQYRRESKASQENRSKDSDTPSMSSTYNTTKGSDSRMASKDSDMSSTYTTGKSSDARAGSSTTGSSKSTDMDSRKVESRTTNTKGGMSGSTDATGKTSTSGQSTAQWIRNNNPSTNANNDDITKKPEYEGRLYGEDRTTTDQTRDRNSGQRRFINTQAEKSGEMPKMQQKDNSMNQRNDMNQRTEGNKDKWQSYKEKDKTDEMKEKAAEMKDKNKKSWDVNGKL